VNAAVTQAIHEHHAAPKTSFKSVVSSLLSSGGKAVGRAAEKEIKKEGPKMATKLLETAALAFM
jgi:hypothetical protein